MKTIKIKENTHNKIKKLQTLLFEEKIKCKTLDETIEYAVELLVKTLKNDK